MVFVDFNTCFTDPKQFIRLIVLLTCVCVTLYQLEQCVKKLMHPPISTSNKLILNQTIKYPAITICKKPMFKTDLFPKYGLRKRTELSNRGAFSSFHFGNHSLDEFMNETTFSLSETIFFYGFSSVVQNPDVNTTSNLYLKLGRCHTFKTDHLSSKFSIDGGILFYLGNANKLSKRSGVVQSMESLITTLGNSKKDGYSNLTNNNHWPTYLHGLESSSGYNVFIHDSSEFITDQPEQMETYSQFIFIEPGESVYLTIEAKEFHMVDHPDEPCVPQRNYSQSRCLEQCMHDKLMVEYGCSLPWMRGDLDYPLCNNSEVIDNISAILNSERTKLAKTCICPISCHLYFYLPKVVQRKSMSFGDNSLIALYYTSNIVTVVEEIVSYDWSSFLADLGGSFGLFLGLSVIGFIEVIEAGFRLLYRKRRQKLEEEERVTSLRDQRVVGKLIEYLLTCKNRNSDVIFEGYENRKY